MGIIWGFMYFRYICGMARPKYEPLPYVSKRGRKIFYSIVRHINDSNLMESIDIIELSMLSNSYDVFEVASAECNLNGYVLSVTGKNGTFDQSSPWYTVMKNEYANILKHSPKYGLNPGDRHKIFGGMKKKKKSDPNSGLD